MKREQRIKWFQETLKLKQINANNGKENCAHCALRLNDYIREGRADSVVQPVPTSSARLLCKPVIKNGSIAQSSINDARIMSRCVVPNSSNSSPYIIDITNDNLDAPIFDLTDDETGKPSLTNQARLVGVDTKTQDLNKLLKSQSRAEDGTCFGFIVLTHASKSKNDFTKGHILNYFVDENNEIYFVDAQNRMISQTLSLLTGYRNEVFYIQSMPKNGFKLIKDNAATNTNTISPKQERASIMPNENNTIDTLIEAAVQAAKEKNDKKMQDLLNQDFLKLGKNINSTNGKHFNVAVQLGILGDECSFYWLKNYGVHPIDFACGAAYANNQKLADKYLDMMDKDERDYVKVACFALKGNNLTLGDYYYDKITDATKRQNNYNHLATKFAFAGNKTIVEHYLNKITDETKRDYALVANSAEKGGHPELASLYREKERQRNVSQSTLAHRASPGLIPLPKLSTPIPKQPATVALPEAPLPAIPSSWPNTTTPTTNAAQRTQPHHTIPSSNPAPINPSATPIWDLSRNQLPTKRPASPEPSEEVAILNRKIKQLEIQMEFKDKEIKVKDEEIKNKKDEITRLHQLLNETMQPAKKQRLG